jgi:hypothetical protein
MLADWLHSLATIVNSPRWIVRMRTRLASLLHVDEQ